MTTLDYIQQDPAYLKAKDLTHVPPPPDEKDVVTNVGVPQSIYLDYIKNEIENENSCLQLPMTILLLISFSSLALAHLGQGQVFAVEESIEHDITENANFAFAHYFGHKGIVDVNSYADFWSWMRLGYLPLIIQPTWVYSESYPAALGEPIMKGTSYSVADLPTSWLFKNYGTAAPVQNDYMRYHKIIGGIRMSQELVPPKYDDCRSSTEMGTTIFKSWFKKPCMPSGSAELPPELHQTENFELTRTQWLLPEIDSLDELTHVLLDMEDGCHFARSTGAPLSSCRCTWCKEQNPVQPWIDEETLRAEAAFVIFNPVYGLYTYVGCNFFFNRGGHIHKFINVMSAWSDPNSKPMEERIVPLMWDCIWVTALLYVVVCEVKEIYFLIKYSRERWWKTLKTDYLGMWNVIDWVSIIIAMIIIQFYIRMRFAVGDVNVQLAEVMKLGVSSQKHDRATYEKAAETFFMLVQNMCSSEKEFRRMLCVYPMIVMMRLFKSFKAQPRLALVTSTMVKAKEDMLHFTIVFLSVYVCMMVNAILFFGQDVQEFGSVPRAIHSCFRAMFGDWDWEKMKEIGFLKALIWFWLFMIIMVLLLLNMLLAIVMDAYGEVKGKARDAIRLDTQIKEMYRRSLQAWHRQRRKLNDVYDAFLKEAGNDEKAMLQDEKLLKPQDVCSRIELPQKQAMRTLVASLKKKWANDKEEEEKTMGEDETKEVIKKTLINVEDRTKLLEKDASYIKERLGYWDRLQVPGDPEYDYHFGEGDAHQHDSVDLAGAVDSVSDEIGTMFTTNMNKIESMQESLENQQNELHSLLSEMQMMVDQQARCVKGISEDLAALEAETEAEPTA